MNRPSGFLGCSLVDSVPDDLAQHAFAGCGGRDRTDAQQTERSGHEVPPGVHDLEVAQDQQQKRRENQIDTDGHPKRSIGWFEVAVHESSIRAAEGGCPTVQAVVSLSF
mgnify:CR=1 FL=1